MLKRFFDSACDFEKKKRFATATILIAFFAVVAFVGVGTMGCGGHDDVDPCVVEQAVTLTVTYGGDSQDVFLGDLEGSPDGDMCLVSLADVVNAADSLSINLQASDFDFEAEDGFRPTSVGCARVAGSDLDLGWVDWNTGSLVWDDSLGFEGCHYVREMVTIDASDTP